LIPAFDVGVPADDEITVDLPASGALTLPHQ
jgi:hypothetical protein